MAARRRMMVARDERTSIAAGEPGARLEPGLGTGVPMGPADRAQVAGVLIVDDHPVVRSGIRLSLLSCPDMIVVGEAGSGEEALRLVERIHPQIILMDLMMPGMGGIEAIRALHARVPEARILVMSSFEDGELVREALRAGAIGYELKSAALTDFVRAIRSAAAGRPSLAPVAAQALARVALRGRARRDNLTEREREVLRLLARGLSNAAMAEQLVVSPATIKFHLRGIRSKLGAVTRTQTVAVALRHRLVPQT